MHPIIMHKPGALRNSLHAIVRVVALLMLVAGVLLSAPAMAQQESRPSVTELQIDGAITPVMATYVGRGIDEAVERGDDAVLIRMDTPGGLSSAMSDIIDDILASPVPVIVYVAPEGARAASAGMYISYAAHVSVMAPVTNIGSATPVQLGGDGGGGDGQTASEQKAINDAVAQVRELAELRGRNADWAERAVREAANVGASEAAEMNVVDFIAADTGEVLAQADGMTVTVQGNGATVRTAGASVDSVDMSFFEQVLQVIVDPNIAFILMSLGTLGLIFELSNPGTIVPGVAGAVMLVTGLYALGTLNSNWSGFILIALAFLLFVAEIFVASGGLLAAGGVVAFLFGGLLLSNTRNDEVLQISRTLVFTVTAVLGAFFFFVAGSVLKSRRKPAVSGESTLVGRRAEARTDLDPSGMVFLFGELWRATVVGDAPVAEGDQVEVVSVEGMRLQVVPVTGHEPDEETQAEAEAEEAPEGQEHSPRRTMEQKPADS